MTYLSLTPTNHPQERVVIAGNELAVVIASHPDVTYIRLTTGRTLLVRESLVDVLALWHANEPLY